MARNYGYSSYSLGGGSGGGGSSVTLLSTFKSADQSISSQTTLQNATDLVLSLSDAGTYAIEGFMVWQTPAAADLKIAFSGASTIKWQADWNRATGVTTGTNTLVCNGINNTDRCTPIRGLLPITGATTLQFQFAQNTSNGGNTILRKDSWLYAIKLD